MSTNLYEYRTPRPSSHPAANESLNRKTMMQCLDRSSIGIRSAYAYELKNAGTSLDLRKVNFSLQMAADSWLSVSKLLALKSSKISFFVNLCRFLGFLFAQYSISTGVFLMAHSLIFRKNSVIKRLSNLNMIGVKRALEKGCPRAIGRFCNFFCQSCAVCKVGPSAEGCRPSSLISNLS